MSGKKGMKKCPAGIREDIVAKIRSGADQREFSRKYGISRYAIQSWLREPTVPKQRGRKPAKHYRNINRNPKTVLRNMKKCGLLSKIRRRRKWVNPGQKVHKYKNLLKRQFREERPNSKWVTDISYIHTKEGVLYLSMIRDLYDNNIVAYKTATQQAVNLVLVTTRIAMKKEKMRVAAELQLHSDQGFQYTSQA